MFICSEDCWSGAWSESNSPHFHSCQALRLVLIGFNKPPNKSCKLIHGGSGFSNGETGTNVYQKR